MPLHSKKDGPPRSVHRYHFPNISQQSSLPVSTPVEQLYDSPQQVTAKYQALMEEGHEAGFAEGVRSGLEQGKLQGLEHGLQAGMKEGREAGHQQAYQECKPNLDAALDKVEQIYNSLESALQETLDWQRESLCRLVSQVCRQVLRTELTQKPTQILPLIEETLALLPKPQGSVSIQLDPATHDLLKEYAPESLERWALQPDPQLSPGSFHIQTGLAEAESKLDDRLDLCVDQLRNQLADTTELNGLEASNVEPCTISPHNSPWRKEDMVSDLSLPVDKLSDDDFRG